MGGGKGGVWEPVLLPGMFYCFRTKQIPLAPASAHLSAPVPGVSMGLAACSEVQPFAPWPGLALGSPAC